MTLDREAEALLYWVSTSKAVPLFELAPEDARREYRRSLAKSDIAPPEVGRVLERTIDGPGGPIGLRIYWPENAPQAAAGGGLPGILFLHGGGCVVGDLDTHDSVARSLCLDVGAVVVSVDYRLAPEHPFPAGVEDCVAALTWFSHNAGALGADPERLAIVGDSAGGGLASVAVHECLQTLAAPLKAQVLIYPTLDLRARLPSRTEHADLFPNPVGVIDWFHDLYFGAAWPIADPRAMPLLYPDFSGLPPALVIAAGYDPFRDEAHEYAERLAQAGTPAQYLCYEGTLHGFLNMGRVLRRAYGRARKDISTFLLQTLTAARADQDA